MIARWTGTAWEPFAQSGIRHALDEQTAGGLLEGYINDLIVYDDGSGPALYVGGVTRAFTESPWNGPARWDGVVWRTLGGGLDPSWAQVYRMAVYDDGHGAALYVAGDIGYADGIRVANIAKWDGLHWEALGAGIPDSSAIDALAVFDDGGGAKLYVGGSFHHAGGYENYIAG